MKSTNQSQETGGGSPTDAQGFGVFRNPLTPFPLLLGWPKPAPLQHSGAPSTFSWGAADSETLGSCFYQP